MPLSRTLASVLIAFALLATGCEPAPPAGNSGNGQAGNGHDHDHEHHHHEEGPNGGHLLKLAESGYQAEWLHDDEAGKITVHILDGEKKPAAVAYSVDFETTVGEATNSYSLAAESPDNDGLASTFTITNPALLTDVRMAEQSEEAAKAVLIAGLQNGEVRAAIEVHDHDHAH